MFSQFRKKFIGDRAFYKIVLSMVIPMILQNLVTNFVSLIDNIMVGSMGTEPMSGVSIVNQFIFVFNVTVFGAVAGPSIFGAQFFGKGDHEGQKYTFRFRLLICTAIIIAAAAVFEIFGSPLIKLFISKESAPQQAEEILGYGMDYLRIMVFSLIPFAIGQAYSSIVRECGETRVPMVGAMSAVGINVLLDYGLIFGKLGMPAMGVKGAAIATVIAKTVEALVSGNLGTHSPSAQQVHRGSFPRLLHTAQTYRRYNQTRYSTFYKRISLVTGNVCSCTVLFRAQYRGGSRKEHIKHHDKSFQLGISANGCLYRYTRGSKARCEQAEGSP